MLVLLRSRSPLGRAGSSTSRRLRSPHPLDPLSARRSRLERIAEVLGLASDLPVLQLHDAHRVGRLPIVSEDEFGDPEIAVAQNASHREALPARLCGARHLYVAPAADALAGLRILEAGGFAVHLLLPLDVPATS